jgi:hypothetical protein
MPGRRHKPLADWGRQVLLLTGRWLPGRRLIAVADTTYAVIELLAAVRHRLTMVTRLRLDARLFDPPRHAGPAPEAAAGSPASASPCNGWLIRPAAGAAWSASGMATADGSWIF